MKTNKHIDGAVTIVHAAGTSLAAAHAAAKTIAGVRILSTFRAWTGTVYSLGVVGRSWAQIDAQVAA